jgi:hypothetical protein
MVADDGTELIIPAGALSQDDAVTISVPSSVSDAGIPSNVTGTPAAREVRLGKPDTVLAKSVTLKVPYRDSDVTGLNASKLRLYRWNETEGRWTLVTTSLVDLANKRVSAELTSFSVYRIMGYAPSTGPVIAKKDVYSAPNPARGDVVHFKIPLQDDADVTVEVFNVAGDKVVEFKKSGFGASVVHIPWTIRDMASGVYIYRVEAKSSARKDVVTKKLAIIH